MKSFYLIFNPESSYPPKVKFATEKEAIDVAKKCIPKFDAEEMYVLKTTVRVTKADTPLKVTRLK